MRDALCHNCRAREGDRPYLGVLICETCADLYLALHERDEARTAARRALRLAHHSRLMAKRAGLDVDVEGGEFGEIVDTYPWIVERKETP